MRTTIEALARALAREAAALGAALYPPLCWLCRRARGADGYGCDEHALGPARLDPRIARCTGCALALPEGIHGGLCAACRRHDRGYRRLVAAGMYGRKGARDGALREWILAFKHGGRSDLAQPLAAFLAQAWSAPEGAVLTGVPLHPLRRLERGHDQARSLAEELAGRTGLQHVPALRRRRWTAPQGAALSVSRSANVAGAFALVARHARALAGRELWLVDDVVTSGATVRACAEVLRGARPAGISVLALARAERDDGWAPPATLERSEHGP